MDPNSSSYTIRKIKRQDNPDLAMIIRFVCEEFNATRPGTIYHDPGIDDLYSYYSVNRAVCFVAEANGKIAGCAGIYPTEALPHGYCEFVKFYLLPAYRGMGIGKELLNKCLDYAKTQEYTTVYLESVPEYINAVVLYQRNGFSFLKGPLGNSGHFGCTIWMTRSL